VATANQQKRLLSSSSRAAMAQKTDSDSDEDKKEARNIFSHNNQDLRTDNSLKNEKKRENYLTEVACQETVPSGAEYKQRQKQLKERQRQKQENEEMNRQHMMEKYHRKLKQAEVTKEKTLQQQVQQSIAQKQKQAAKHRKFYTKQEEEVKIQEVQRLFKSRVKELAQFNAL